MKMFSILLAWAEDDDDQGTFGWSGLAADLDDAEKQARAASAESNNGFEEKPAACIECGCTDNDGTDICPDCGGAIESPDYSEFEASGPVLDSMEGCDMWAAPDMLAALLPVHAAAPFGLSDGAIPLEPEERVEVDLSGAEILAIRAAIAKATGGAAPAPAPTPAVTVEECLAALEHCVSQLSRKRPRKLDFDLELAIAEAGKIIHKAQGGAQ